MDSQIQVLPKPDWVSWDTIHDVIWKAHEVNRNKGIVMRYPSLTGEEIRERIEGQGTMFVAICDGKVVGTAALKTKKVCLWCGGGEYAYLCFAAVLPEYGGRGIYRMLYARVEDETKSKGLDRIMFDSHEGNKKILEIHKRDGFIPVSYRKYEDHFNIIMVKWLNGCPYSRIMCYLKYHKIKYVRRHTK